MDTSRNYSFTTAMLDYFGKLPGQSTVDFAGELKSLTEADRTYFREALASLGYKLI